MEEREELGAVLQVDGETYAIAPHLPCGVVTPDQLRRIAEVAEKYDAKLVKITGATRIALIGLKPEAVKSAWADLGLGPGQLVGLCVRSVRACPGNLYCRLGQLDSLAMGLKLDQLYHGRKLPNKCKMAVSGCPINCAESWVRDVGLFAQNKKWVLVVGGNVGSRPRIAQELARGLDDEAALSAIARVIAYYEKNAKRGERLGRTLERLGLSSLQEYVGG